MTEYLVIEKESQNTTVRVTKDVVDMLGALYSRYRREGKSETEALENLGEAWQVIQLPVLSTYGTDFPAEQLEARFQKRGDPDGYDEGFDAGYEQGYQDALRWVG